MTIQHASRTKRAIGKGDKRTASEPRTQINIKRTIVHKKHGSCGHDQMKLRTQRARIRTILHRYSQRFASETQQINSKAPTSAPNQTKTTATTGNNQLSGKSRSGDQIKQRVKPTGRWVTELPNSAARSLTCGGGGGRRRAAASATRLDTPHLRKNPSSSGGGGSCSSKRRRASRRGIRAISPRLWI
ncbi:B1143G03.10 [Oryza sativa (japonica cultivar-group)]